MSSSNIKLNGVDISIEDLTKQLSNAGYDVDLTKKSNSYVNPYEDDVDYKEYAGVVEAYGYEYDSIEDIVTSFMKILEVYVMNNPKCLDNDNINYCSLLWKYRDNSKYSVANMILALVVRIVCGTINGYPGADPDQSNAYHGSLKVLDHYLKLVKEEYGL
jgi:hypothetical protein